MNQFVVMAKSEVETMIAEAVARGIDRMRPIILKAATEYLTEEETEIRFGLPKRTLAAWRKENGERPSNICEISCLDFAGEVYREAFGIRSETEEIISNEIRFTVILLIQTNENNRLKVKIYGIKKDLVEKIFKIVKKRS